MPQACGIARAWHLVKETKLCGVFTVTKNTFYPLYSLPAVSFLFYFDNQTFFLFDSCEAELVVNYL